MSRIARHRFRPEIVRLEDRVTPAAPSPPVIIEPFFDGQITGAFDINIQTDPAQYFDPDGHAWQSTEWEIRQVSTGQTVWQTGFISSPPLVLYRVDFSDGAFVGALAGQNQLAPGTNYELRVRYRDSNNETSLPAVRTFTTAAPTQPVPGAGQWLVRQGYVVEPVLTNVRMAVNIAFVPNPGPNPTDPLYYVAELYGSIRVVQRNGQSQLFATGLLDYNPQGPISGVGEQGLTGIAVERDSVNPDVYNLYVTMLWDNGAPAGGPNHYPKVERITSTVGGLSLASRTVLLNMQPETQGQSHQISNISIGPDGKLYVHMGDGFDASTGLNLDQYRGKILRMNKDGTPVATGDPAGANPFYDASNGINARDYIWAYGFRNPFGGAWRPGTNQHWIVENGNGIDRMTDVVGGQSYGWSGSDAAMQTFSKYVWSPSTAPVNITIVAPSVFGGSGFPAEAQNSAFVSLSGSTYASGVQPRAKSIEQFTDLTTLNPQGKLAVPPQTLVKYNGTGRASIIAVAAGPDGLYFSDFYEDTGANGATAPGSNIYRVRYVGNAGGQVPTVATAAAVTPNPVVTGSTANVSVLGADDGGEANLTYTWSTIGNPPAPVSFSPNGTNAAKNAVASFSANGAYTLAVIIRDAGGQAVISTTTVTVSSIADGNGDGLAATYFNNINFTGTTVTRIDPTIDFTWGAGSPDPAIAPDTFSARWTGFVQPRFSGQYTFITTSDDGVRLTVNNQLIINQFIDQAPTEHTGTITLTAGVAYPILLEYYENGGGAMIRLEWQSAQQPRQVIPQSQLYSNITLTPPNPPNGLILTPVTRSLMRLNWNDNSNNESSFRIERSTDGTNFSLVAIVPADTTSYQDAGLTPGTYFYRIQASNSGGNSSYTSGVGSPTTNLAPLFQYTGFTGATGLTLNGGAGLIENRIRITDGGLGQSRSAFRTTRSDIRRFTTTFDFELTGGTNVADGFTFTVTGAGPNSLGSAGGGLGYGTDGGPGQTARILQSLAVKFDLYNNAGEGANSTGVYTNGADPILPAVGITGVDLRGGRPVRATITYNGADLFMTLLDLVNQQTFQRVFTGFDIPALVGGGTGFVGFTGGTGGLTATQDILNWSYTPLPLLTTPTVTVNAGSVQRSRVTELDVQFGGAVKLLPGAFSLTNGAGVPITGVNIIPETVINGPGTLVNLTFTGPNTINGSLIDGNYRLVINGNNILDQLGAGVDADVNGSPGGSSFFAFHRLFGDADGNKVVNAADFLAFRLAYLSNTPAFDLNNNGTVDSSDFLAFRLNFLAMLP
jgi:glucose/arabinose dehydrogenase